MSMIDKVPYLQVEGTANGPDLVVFALSTCAFCEKAMAFLKEHGLAFRYIHLDTLPIDEKKQLKTELKEKFKDVPVFPILMIDGTRALSGFLQDRWANTLGLA